MDDIQVVAVTVPDATVLMLNSVMDAMDVLFVITESCSVGIPTPVYLHLRLLEPSAPAAPTP